MKNKWITLGLGMALCGILVVGTFYFLFRSPVKKGGSSFTQTLDNIFVILDGQQQSFEEGAKLVWDGKNAVLTDGTSELQMDGAPLYDGSRGEGSSSVGGTDGSAVTLTRNMIYMQPGKAKPPTRITGLSQLTYDGTVVQVIHEKEISQAADGFLFDGENVYLFLEPVTVTWRGESVSLGILSFIRMIPGSSLEIYDTQTGETTYFGIGNVTVTVQASDWTIDAGNDTYEDPSGNYLLFTDPEIFSIYKD